jgi:hypothetical protein
MKFIDDLCKVKYMSRFILVLAALFLVLIGGCGKSQKHFKLDPAFKQYFLFKNGSKWLYSSVSDTSDKETITSHDLMEGKMFWDAQDQEFIQVDLFSDRDSSYKLRAIADDQDVNRAVVIVKDVQYKKTMEWFSAFGVLSGIKGTGDSFTLHPTYVVEGNTYNNVVELKPASPVRYKRLFMAPGVGIVRKEMLSGKTYVLKSYLLQ